MTVQSVDASKAPFASFYFTNIGITDASNVVIQTKVLLFSPRELMESSGFDPAVELEKFRANPQETFDEMRAWDKQHEEMYRQQGMSEMADNIHRAAERRKSLFTPKRIIPKISHGTDFGQQLDIPASSNMTVRNDRHVVFILIDWDDVLPTHRHHTNDLCFFIESATASPCVSPVHIENK
jgi:hypothetical protein